MLPAPICIIGDSKEAKVSDDGDDDDDDDEDEDSSEDDEDEDEDEIDDSVIEGTVSPKRAKKKVVFFMTLTVLRVMQKTKMMVLAIIPRMKERSSVMYSMVNMAVNMEKSSVMLKRHQETKHHLKDANNQLMNHHPESLSNVSTTVFLLIFLDTSIIHSKNQVNWFRKN